MTYGDSLRADTDLNDTGEMGGLMADKVLWRQRNNTQTLKNEAALSQVSQIYNHSSVKNRIHSNRKAHIQIIIS